MQKVIALCALGWLAGCQMPPPEAGLAVPARVGVFKQNSPEWRGQKFAVNRCSHCHSVAYAETSPLPAAPSFQEIASSPDLSKVTLSKWLRDHRNYPDQMYFEIPAEHIDDVVAYMITLRRAD
jgi:hypothetical protein